MKTFLNRFGEYVTKWESHVHPDNPHFMQVVRYVHSTDKEGRNRLNWSIDNFASNKKHVIYDIELKDAILKYKPLLNDEPR